MRSDRLIDKNSRILQQRNVYAVDGYVPLGQLIDVETAERLKQAFITSIEADTQSSSYGILRHNVWRQIDAFAEIINAGELARLVRELLDAAEIVLFQDNVICKPPGTTSPIQWHQDYSYWPLASPHGTTLWIALDEVCPANGCICYLPGSHAWGEGRPSDFVSEAGQPQLAGAPGFDFAAHAQEAIDMTLSPGEAVAHHPLTAHMSPGNLTQQNRIGYSLTWITGDVCWAPEHAPHPYNYYLRPQAGSLVHGSLFPRFR